MLVSMSEEQQPEELSRPAQVKSPGPRRRGRRGGRGRSRGPRQQPPAAPVEGIPAHAPADPFSEPSTPAESPAKRIEPEPPIRLREEMPVRPVPSKQRIQPPAPAVISTPVSAPAPVARVAHAVQPGGSAIGQIVGEVRHIVESLEQSLEQMEEVLRLVELAEHQKFTDERELESLRRALHKLQPPHRERREENH
jgi:hypothetical protein